MPKDKEIKCPPVTVCPPENPVPRSAADMFSSPIPEDREACIELIMRDIAQTYMVTALRYWHVGKILYTCHERGDDSIYTAVQDAMGCQERLLHECERAYKTYPDGADLQTLSKVLDWSDIKKTLQLRLPENRTLLLNKISSGEIGEKQAPEVVEQLVRSEQEDRQQDAGKPDKRTRVAKAHNPSTVFDKAARRVQNFVRDMEQAVVDVRQSIDHCHSNAVTEEEFTAHAGVFDNLDRALKDAAGLLLEQQKVLAQRMNDGPPADDAL